MDEEPRGDHGGSREKKVFGKGFLAQSLGTPIRNATEAKLATAAKTTKRKITKRAES